MLENKDIFTVEETNLMCIFNTTNKDALILELTAAIPAFDELELVEIAENAVRKLSKMTDTEFAALELYPEYKDYDEEGEV